ncbi:MAG: GTP-binding protein [Clostridia bacterium]|nr:GTP-binding protein [Clostridia bacterium]
MTKIDIFSGFLGAGKTTLIKKLIKEAYAGEKLVLIENEFGEIGIDGGFMQDAGIEVTEMNSGCICCSLVGDFGEALKKVLSEYTPDRILIEPSGVGKLSDVIRAVQGIEASDAVLNAFTTVADVNKCKMYLKNFGEFFGDQIKHAGTIVLSHTQSVSDDKIEACVELLREHNPACVIVTTPWDSLSGAQLLEAMEKRETLEAELESLKNEEVCPECGHHHEHGHHHHDCECHEHEHHHHDHDCDCHEHEHHHHDHDCDCHEHEHYHHDHDCDCHEHEHHHHDHDCCCHEHHHDHHHHHADEVFTSWGKETAKKFTKEQIEAALNSLGDEAKYGTILRAKGIVAGTGDSFIHFDYVPGEPDIREGSAAVIGRLCVIGSGINEDALAELFEI